MKLNLPILTLLAILSIGCGKEAQNNDAVFESIKVGMTTEEVQKILGEPTSKVEEISGFMMLWEMENGETIGVTTDDAGVVTSTSR